MTGHDLWEWDVEDAFNPRYDARVSEEGVAYGCEIQGPFCGYDAHGRQSWKEFFASGPPEKIHMPAHILAAIREHGRKLTGGG